MVTLYYYRIYIYWHAQIITTNLKQEAFEAHQRIAFWDFFFNNPTDNNEI